MMNLNVVDMWGDLYLAVLRDHSLGPGPPAAESPPRPGSSQVDPQVA